MARAEDTVSTETSVSDKFVKDKSSIASKLRALILGLYFEPENVDKKSPEIGLKPMLEDIKNKRHTLNTELRLGRPNKKDHLI